VIVTVDCGISAVEGVACARAAGVEVIVTDHHLVPEELPEGAVVVNPRQPGCSYPFKELAACGIAYKLALAVGARTGFPLLARVASARGVSRHDRRPRAPDRGKSDPRFGGLAALAEARAPGLRALLLEAGSRPVSAPMPRKWRFGSRRA
jgi:single-stranded-DNA-specific exonuclease